MGFEIAARGAVARREYAGKFTVQRVRIQVQNHGYARPQQANPVGLIDQGRSGRYIENCAHWICGRYRYQRCRNLHFITVAERRVTAARLQNKRIQVHSRRIRITIETGDDLYWRRTEVCTGHRRQR